MITRCKTSVLMVLVCAFAQAGCASRDRHVEMKDYPPPREGPVQAGPERPPAPPLRPQPDPVASDPIVVKAAVEPLAGRLSDEEKQEIVHSALLNIQRMVISSDVQLALSGTHEATMVAADLIASKLAELGFRVTQSTSRLEYDPSEHRLDAFRKHNDCNLAIVIEGGAQAGDRFGNFWSFTGELKGKVLNLTTHQVIASTTIRKQGRRALDERGAAQDAIESAAADLATYLTDEMARKVEATSLVRMRMTCTDLDHWQEADDVRIGLQRRPGIYYVSMEHWDKQSDRGVLEVLCRFDVQQFLPSYVDELRKGRIQVVSVEQAGKVIRSDQDLVD
jgi:hypothetical protein